MRIIRGVDNLVFAAITVLLFIVIFMYTAYQTQIFDVMSHSLDYLSNNSLNLVTSVIIGILSGVISGFLVLYIQNRLTKHLVICKSMIAYHGFDHPAAGPDTWIKISIWNSGKSKIDYLNITFEVNGSAEFGVIKGDDRTHVGVQYLGSENKKNIRIKDIFPESGMAFAFQIFNIKNPEQINIIFHSEIKPEIIDFLSNDLYWVSGKMYKDAKTIKGKLVSFTNKMHPYGYSLGEGEVNPDIWEGKEPY